MKSAMLAAVRERACHATCTSMSITPFDADGAIDEALFRAHLRFLARRGGVGVYVASQGSGEGDLLVVRREGRAATRSRSTSCAGSVPVVAAGIGLAGSTAAIAELARRGRGGGRRRGADPRAAARRDAAARRRARGVLPLGDRRGATATCTCRTTPCSPATSFRSSSSSSCSTSTRAYARSTSPIPRPKRCRVRAALRARGPTCASGSTARARRDGALGARGLPELRGERRAAARRRRVRARCSSTRCSRLNAALGARREPALAEGRACGSSAATAARCARRTCRSTAEQHADAVRRARRGVAFRSRRGVGVAVRGSRRARSAGTPANVSSIVFHECGQSLEMCG